MFFFLNIFGWDWVFFFFSSFFLSFFPFSFFFWTSVECRPMTSLVCLFVLNLLPCFLLFLFFFFFFFLSLLVIHRSSGSFVSVCVCVGGGGVRGTRLTPHTYLYMRWGMVLRAFIIIRNYNNSIIISVVKHTGEDTQYIYRCVLHFPATTPFV